jgi:phytoene desaturase
VKIGIIGAGIAGLASAVRMASRGYEVEVFESNSYPGGKLSEFELSGYRFDAGPSLFTMPHYVEELYEVAGYTAPFPFEYERLPVVCHYFWEDDTQLKAYADKEAFAREVKSKLDVNPEDLMRAFEDSAKKYELTGRIFLEKSLHRWDTWSDWKVAKAMLAIPGLDLFSSMNKVNERHFNAPKMVQLFNRFATYNGSNPYKAPGLLNIIPHFEHDIGAFFPKGGMYNIVKSIYNLAKELGVQFHFEAPVQEILVENGQVKGLRVDGASYVYDHVISNMDVFFTYERLLPNAKRPKRILRQQKSTSALIFYWGIKHTFPELGLHNIFFSDHYEAEFAAMEAGTLHEDPTVYVNISQKCEKGDAPAGGENWFTMINAPYNAGQDWDQLIELSRQRIIDKLSRMLKTDVKALIECEEILDPRTIESKTLSHLGALYGTSSNNRMAAFLRHANFSRKIKGLYFCGGSVHPGGGIPLSLLSAKIVDDLMHAKA